MTHFLNCLVYLLLSLDQSTLKFAFLFLVKLSRDSLYIEIETRPVSIRDIHVLCDFSKIIPEITVIKNSFYSEMMFKNEK